ncbi:MAG: ABC transporter permease [SAR324 cluster bacterium]|nr:ABC transporter permease [SAR324 cluster bacterium]
MTYVTLWKSSLRYAMHHPWQFTLSFLGIALGVAVVVAVDITNESAQRSFADSVETINGKATHVIRGLNGTLPEKLFTKIRLQTGLRQAAPLVQGSVFHEQFPGKVFQILGVDPFSEQNIRGYVPSLGDSQLDLREFLLESNSILTSRDLADSLSWKLGESQNFHLHQKTHSFRLAGFLESPEALEKEMLASIMVMDIANAQLLLQQTGELSHIDLVLPSLDTKHPFYHQLLSLLPNGAVIELVSDRVQSAAQLTKAFSINLNALSLLTLIVGMFLIYNTMTFSVVQRYPLLGRLRAIGVTRNELAMLILSEALLLGLGGTMLGLVGGYLLAHGMIEAVSQTINDLYYSVSVQTVTLSTLTLNKGLLLGVLGTIISTLPPVWHASQSRPQLVLSRSHQETRSKGNRLLLFVLGNGCMFLAFITLWQANNSLIWSYAGLFLFLIGSTLCLPQWTIWIVWMLTPLVRVFSKVIGVMALRNIVAHLSRTGVAMSALMLGIATFISVGGMVHSFRQTVVHWLSSSLRADFYLTAEQSSKQSFGQVLPNWWIHAVEEIPGVDNIGSILRLKVPSEHGVVLVHAAAFPEKGEDSFLFKEKTDQAWEHYYKTPSVFISEPFANRHQLKTGDRLSLKTPQGQITFPILGIVYDYASQQGFAMIHRPHFEKYWQNSDIQGLSIYLSSQNHAKAVRSQLEKLAARLKFPVRILSNRSLRNHTLDVFDRTFLITGILQTLIAVVVFLGMLSALMALQLERKKEMGVLRAVGMLPKQLWSSILQQCTYMGAIGASLALPVGSILAWILIYVINLRSFGWSFPFTLPFYLIMKAFIIAILAAVLAGIYPAWKMSNTSPTLAMKEEA